MKDCTELTQGFQAIREICETGVLPAFTAFGCASCLAPDFGLLIAAAGLRQVSKCLDWREGEDGAEVDVLG